MLRFDAFTVWDNPVVKERLSWYYSVMKNLKPAKFLICKKIPCSINIKEANEEELWKEHERLSQEFRDLFKKVSLGNLKISELKSPPINFLDLKFELLNRMLRHCTFCEWRCKVDRIEGIRKGACRMDATTRVASWFHHFGEEAPLVGLGGSGTIFFAGCIFRCVFCQNWDISQYPLNGAEVDGRRLALIMKNLREEGACNINFVGGEPTPNLHTIIDGVRYLNVNVPLLWNSDMYATEEFMKILVDVIDIWLPDFKYGNDKCALRLSKVLRYFDTVARNHIIASKNGDIIIRHLVLPNHFECCTKIVLKWIADSCPRALVNIMAQYRPDYRVCEEPKKYGDIARRPSTDEMRRAYKYAEELKLIYEPVS
ncbi:MAG: 4Fe-4S cluster-binding domain-containing protein [Nitrososphaerales archaeon]